MNRVSPSRTPVQAPDGIAVDCWKSLFYRSTVHVFDKYARELGKIKIPKAVVQSLFWGYERMQKNLYITTREAVYAVETHVGIKIILSKFTSE